LLLAAAACSSAADTACAHMAAARCRLFDRCSNGFRITATYGTQDNCRARLAAGCRADFVTPTDVNIKPSDLESCATATDAQPCDLFRQGHLVPECLPPPGKEVNGFPCISSAQCQSSYCRPVSELSPCGLCEDQGQLGGGCSYQGGFLYYNGLACAGGKWVQPGDVGATCGPQPCRLDLLCLLGPLSTAPTCSALGAEGASCDLSSPAGVLCDASFGLHCDQATKTCVTTSIVPAGNACEVLAGTFSYCSNSICQSTAPHGPPGVCIAFVPDGQKCDLSGAGPQCAPPANCVADPNGDGVCALRDEAQCL